MPQVSTDAIGLIALDAPESSEWNQDVTDEDRHLEETFARLARNNLCWAAAEDDRVLRFDTAAELEARAEPRVSTPLREAFSDPAEDITYVQADLERLTRQLQVETDQFLRIAATR